MFKKIIQYAKKLGLGILIFLVFYVTAVFLLPKIKVNTDRKPSEEVTIYILSNGMHTDIVMPVENEVFSWDSLVSAKDTRAQNTDLEWVAIGWGDKGFYLDTPTWDDLKFSTAVKAASGFNTTAMHITYYRSVKEAQDCVKINISRQEYAKLVQNIKETFQFQNGKTILIPTDAVYGQNDAFYEAEGRYNIFKTCNTWTNTMLKKAGINAACWLILEKDVLNLYR